MTDNDEMEELEAEETKESLKDRCLKRYSGEEITNPVKAIRAKCMWCSNDSHKEIELCPINDCPLFPFRFGRNPFRTPRVYSDEQKKALAEQLKKTRANKSA